jgi:hypothetical protein
MSEIDICPEYLLEAKNLYDKDYQEGRRVEAAWYDATGAISFVVDITDVDVVKRDDEWHLIGFDDTGKEYCIGDAELRTEDGKRIWKNP